MKTASAKNPKIIKTSQLKWNNEDNDTLIKIKQTKE